MARNSETVTEVQEKINVIEKRLRIFGILKDTSTTQLAPSRIFSHKKALLTRRKNLFYKKNVHQFAKATQALLDKAETLFGGSLTQKKKDDTMSMTVSPSPTNKRFHLREQKMEDIKRLKAKHVSLEELSPEEKNRRDLAHNITTIVRLKEEGLQEVIDFCSDEDVVFIRELGLENLDQEQFNLKLENKLVFLRKKLYHL